jgi:NAD(P)H-flavin reductase
VPTPSFTTTCTQNKKLCHDVWELKFAMPEGEKFIFKAGQFVLWDVPLCDHPEDIQPRAYSIASPPREENELTFVIRYKQDGRCSKWIDEVLKVGDQVRMQGPLGNFTLNTETDKDYIFVGTGTGIAPYMSHLKYALQDQKDTRPMHLFFGVRHEEDLFWVDEFKALDDQYENFTMHLSISQPSDAWDGLKGRVTDIMPTVITDFSRVNAYICGNPAMVKDVKEWLMTNGVEKSDLHQEGYV